MIVRITGDRQYRLDAAAQATLDTLDQHIIIAVDTKEVDTAHQLLTQALAVVTQHGTPLGEAELIASDLILPHEDASLEEIRTLVHA